MVFCEWFNYLQDQSSLVEQSSSPVYFNLYEDISKYNSYLATFLFFPIFIYTLYVNSKS